ncbi:MAG: hypothetical protein CSA15_08545 [Candidatus Delongbacteria bacterium]|nr:MAG: hypothetical protein CSA15_08545 [Candidatus Delongbacteria bacterium]
MFIKRLFIYLLLIFSFVLSQKISYKSVGKLVRLKSGKSKYYNVRELQYGIFGVSCDEAIINKENTSFELMGNVSLWDTTRFIRSEKAILKSYKGKYRAFFSNGVTFDQDSINIRSKFARFSELNSRTIFSDSVILRYINPNLSLYCKNIDVDTKSEYIIAKKVNNLVYMDSTYRGEAITNQIEYDVKGNLLTMPKRVKIEFNEHSLGSVDFKKLTHKELNSIQLKTLPYLKLMAKKGSYNFKTNNPYLKGDVKIFHIDSLGKKTTLFCDTLIGKSSRSKVYFNGNFSIFNDSLSISGKKSALDYKENILKVLKSPSLKFKGNLAVGDSCYIKFSNKKSIESVTIYGDSKISNPIENTYLTNEIKGKYIKIFFEENKPSFLQVNKEAICVYFKPEKGKSDYKKNIISGDTLKVIFEESILSSIQVLGGVRGEYIIGK